MTMRLTMLQIEDILRLDAEAYSKEEISKSVSTSRQTVIRFLAIAEVNDIKWPLSEENIQWIIDNVLSKKHMRNTAYYQPDLQYIHNELAKPNVDMIGLHREYEKNAAFDFDSLKPYSYTQFCRIYREWCGAKKLIMRIMYKPGERMEFDWAGATMSYTDAETGISVKMYVFIAVLPYSMAFYTDAFPNMKLENWVQATCDAFEYFQGVPRLMVPDNLKTAIITHTREKVIAQKNYSELGKHYHTAITPTKVASPTHKSIVESRVHKVETRVIGELRNATFFSAEEVKQALHDRMIELNNTVTKTLDSSPWDYYLKEEKEYMRPLPPTRYELQEWSRYNVHHDYLIQVGKNKYSVPYTCVGQTVDIRLIRRTNEIIVSLNNQTVARHTYVEEKQRNPIVKIEHCPDNHKAVKNYTSENFRAFAESVGPYALQAFNYYLEQGEAEEPQFQFCVSMMHLVELYGKDYFEEACASILRCGGRPELEYLDERLKHNGRVVPKNVAHSTTGFTRGASQFGNVTVSKKDQ